MQPGRVRGWLYSNWFYAGLTASIFLLILTPLLWNSWSRTVLVVYLQLPAYMLHQVEEHYHDRFRRYLNDHVAGGQNALTHEAVLVINLGGLWAVDLTALYLAYFEHPGLGAVAMDMAIVNAAVHIAVAAFLRSYNPGLLSAIFLLLPAGSVGLWMLTQTGQCTVSEQAWGIGLAIAVHAGIVLFLRYRIVSLRDR